MVAQLEYKVVAAPRRPRKTRGVRGTQARFAETLAALMNDMAGEGWEFQRSETLPVEERSGLFGRRTSEQTMLVFRRLRAAEGGTAEQPIPLNVTARRAAPGRAAPPLTAVPGTPRDERAED